MLADIYSVNVFMNETVVKEFNPIFFNNSSVKFMEYSIPVMKLLRVKSFVNLYLWHF